MNDDSRNARSGHERRRHPRIDTLNFVSYVCVDEDGNEIAEGFGTTRDLSQGGVKLETREPIESPYIILLSIDLKEELLEVRGKVVHSTEVGEGRFLSGIEFVDTKDKQIEVVRSFVKRRPG